jgi:hypothetical protein
MTGERRGGGAAMADQDWACQTRPCQFYYGEVEVYSDLDDRTDPVRICWRWLKHHGAFARYRHPVINAILQSFSGKTSTAPATGRQDIVDRLGLEPGDLVEVRSEEEIRATLDENNRYRGLVFMPSMLEFCGKRYRVYKKVVNIKLETTGHMRKIVTPTVFLEGVLCHRCDRECYAFWREAWLKRVPEASPPPVKTRT